MIPKKDAPRRRTNGERGAGVLLCGEHPSYTDRQPAPASVKLRELFNDGGHFVGLEVARA